MAPIKVSNLFCQLVKVDSESSESSGNAEGEGRGEKILRGVSTS